MQPTQPITPFLWFDTQAEEAAQFYVAVFPRSHITAISHYTDVGPGVAGSVMLVDFELDGQRFLALNGGPEYAFTPAISLFVSCNSQAELDTLWDRLAEGGKPVACGWITDRFGLSWQVVPRTLHAMLADADRTRVNRVMEAVLSMVKLDVEALERAFGA